MYDRKQVIRDIPVFIYLFSLVLAAVGIWFFLRNGGPWFIAAILVLIGAIVLIFVPAVLVYVDRSRGLVEIVKIGLIGRRVVEIPISQVAGVYVDHHYRSDSDGSSHTYRVVIVKDDGEEVPLRKSTSSGRNQKVKWADALRNEIGVGGEDEAPMSFRDDLQQAFYRVPMQDQEQATGITPGIQQSNGVSWQMETFTYAGSPKKVPVYRWSSTDLKTPGDFIFIVQKAEGQGQQKGLMKLAGKFLFKTALQMYGFDESYAPGLDGAETVEDVDQRLVDGFFVYTSLPPYAREVLNPWMVRPLVSWSERYELQLSDKDINQLSVLFSPQGLFVSRVGSLDQAEIDELVGLGIELVKAG